jgi:hypothetical protein
MPAAIRKEYADRKRKTGIADAGLQIFFFFRSGPRQDHQAADHSIVQKLPMPDIDFVNIL